MEPTKPHSYAIYHGEKKLAEFESYEAAKIALTAYAGFYPRKELSIREVPSQEGS